MPGSAAALTRNRRSARRRTAVERPAETWPSVRPRLNICVTSVEPAEAVDRNAKCALPERAQPRREHPVPVIAGHPGRHGAPDVERARPIVGPVQLDRPGDCAPPTPSRSRPARKTPFSYRPTAAAMSPAGSPSRPRRSPACRACRASPRHDRQTDGSSCCPPRPPSFAKEPSRRCWSIARAMPWSPCRKPASGCRTSSGRRTSARDKDVSPRRARRRWRR